MPVTMEKPLFDQQGVRKFLFNGELTLSPSQAKLVLANCEFEWQRPISPYEVAVLADEMKRGKWTSKMQLNFAVLPDGRYILVNGYHRLRAQADANKSIEWTVTLHPVKSTAELGPLYNTFDTIIRKRGTSDIIKATSFAADVSLSGDAAKSLYAAMPLIASRFFTTSQSKDYLRNAQPDLRLEMAHRYAKAMRNYVESIHGVSGTLRARFRAAGMTAVAVVTFHHQPETAWKFWQGTAQNDGLKRGDPRRAFVSALQGRQGHRSTETYDMRIILGQPIRAWNAFFEDRDDMLQLTVPNAFVPVILGTPFDGTPPAIVPPKPVK